MLTLRHIEKVSKLMAQTSGSGTPYTEKKKRRRCRNEECDCKCNMTPEKWAVLEAHMSELPRDLRVDPDDVEPFV